MKIRQVEVKAGCPRSETTTCSFLLEKPALTRLLSEISPVSLLMSNRFSSSVSVNRIVPFSPWSPSVAITVVMIWFGRVLMETHAFRGFRSQTGMLSFTSSTCMVSDATELSGPWVQPSVATALRVYWALLSLSRDLVVLITPVTASMEKAPWLLSSVRE